MVTLVPISILASHYDVHGIRARYGTRNRRLVRRSAGGLIVDRIAAARTVMMAVVAVGLLQRQQCLLSAREITVLQRLPNLAQGLRKRIIGIRRLPLTAALQSTQCPIGLLRVREVSGIKRAHQLAEILTELRLGARRLKAALCREDC